MVRKEQVRKRARTEGRKYGDQDSVSYRWVAARRGKGRESSGVSATSPLGIKMKITE